MDIVDNILIWDSVDKSLKDECGNNIPTLKELSEAISSDEVAEGIDNSIDTIIANVIKLKEVLGDSHSINNHINAVLIDTEL